MVGLVRLAPIISEAAADLKQRLVQEFGERLEQVTVFGSAARGEMREDSDVDVLVVLDRIRDHTDRVRAISAAHDAGTDRGIAMCALVLGVADLELLRRRETGLAEDIDRDGVRI